MKTAFYFLSILMFYNAYPQRQWVLNDSTDYTLANTHIVAERHKLYLDNGGTLSLIHDFTQEDEPEYYIRDFDFITPQIGTYWSAAGISDIPRGCIKPQMQVLTGS